MAQVQAETVVAVPPDVAFAVSQTTGGTRYRWDPFVREQHFLDGATLPAKGVRTATVSRHRLRMVSRYVSWAPGSHVGMTMTEGPWFFEVFAGSWRFTPTGDGGTRAVWRYVFRCRPRWAAGPMEAVGQLVLGRDVRRRIAGFARGCADPVVLAAVRG
ncbi:SRPBCC family protein [Modestobacter sp. Leaf380]|uniref:SRPBCC family protein n=1 Tax=Modestobacter sp. Leaf380 TaxID=1736356 RepID=UPI0006F88EAF|nr:SRPBCC family protein [Modestobacter sp. Leaf380]KQS66736.1 polyketide cyclase [Modestobacter sp. Leaf380]